MRHLTARFVGGASAFATGSFYGEVFLFGMGLAACPNPATGAS